MEPYNDLLIPIPFGLQNTGVICYFNSFLQILCGCSSLTKVILDNKEYLTTRTGIALAEYVDLYTSNMASIESSTRKILHALCLDLRERRPNIIFGSNQESAHEVFILLLDMLEPNDNLESSVISSIKSPITKLFLHKGMWNLYCKGCNTILSKEVDYGVIFDMHHIDSIAYENSSKGFSNLIRQHTSSVSEYKCKNCKKITETFRIYDLRKIPEIVFCSFNVYHGKNCRYFPQTLEFPAIEENKKHIFKLIGQIEHAGTLSGGHYWAKGLRKNNQIYEFNDMGVSPILEFKSTQNTYIITYHFSHTE